MYPKQKLIILSDLWGTEKSNWIDHYMRHLVNYYDIEFYDCCDIAEVDKTTYKQEILHTQFINGGVDRAIHRLLEKNKESIDIMAFSIGGVIAWKATLLGMKTRHLYAVSSTRLRLEVVNPSCSVQLFFGENDLYKPDDDWFQKLNIKKHILEGEDHNVYQKEDFANTLCKVIMDNLQ